MKSFIFCVLVLPALVCPTPINFVGPTKDSNVKGVEVTEDVLSRIVSPVITDSTEPQIDQRFNLQALASGVTRGLGSIIEGLGQTGSALIEGVFGTPLREAHGVGGPTGPTGHLGHVEHSGYEHQQPITIGFPGLAPYQRSNI